MQNLKDRHNCINIFKFHISVLLRHKENRKAPGVSRDASERLCAPLADKEFCIRGWKRSRNQLNFSLFAYEIDTGAIDTAFSASE